MEKLICPYPYGNIIVRKGEKNVRRRPWCFLGAERDVSTASRGRFPVRHEDV